jgi:hypothetical protein
MFVNDKGDFKLSPCISQDELSRNLQIDHKRRVDILQRKCERVFPIEIPKRNI